MKRLRITIPVIFKVLRSSGLIKEIRTNSNYNINYNINSRDVVPTSPDYYNTPASHDNIIKNNVEFSNSSNHDKSVVDEQEAASHDTPAPRRFTRVRRPLIDMAIT